MANGNNHKNKKKRWIIISIVSAAVVAAGHRGGCCDSWWHQDRSQRSWRRWKRATWPRALSRPAKSRPITKVEIKSKASGIVKKLYVDAGDRVKQGQVLAELDKIEIEAQVNSAKAQLLSSEANLKSAEADLKRAEVDAKGVDIPTLQRAYERATNMAKDGVVSASGAG